MITAVIVVSIVMAYFVMGGVVGGVVFMRLHDEHPYGDEEFPAFFAGLFWPIVLPVGLGIWIAGTPERKRLRAAAAKRRERELEKELGFKPLDTPTLDDLRPGRRKDLYP